jgi:hypothetical protein
MIEAGMIVRRDNFSQGRHEIKSLSVSLRSNLKRPSHEIEFAIGGKDGKSKTRRGISCSL